MPLVPPLDVAVGLQDAPCRMEVEATTRHAIRTLCFRPLVAVIAIVILVQESISPINVYVNDG